MLPDQEDLGTNYALRLTDAVEDAVAVVTASPTPEDSFARRLNEAIAAITQAQTPAVAAEPHPGHPEPHQPAALGREGVAREQSKPAGAPPEALERAVVQPEQSAPHSVQPAARRDDRQYAGGDQDEGLLPERVEPANFQPEQSAPHMVQPAARRDEERKQPRRAPVLPVAGRDEVKQVQSQPAGAPPEALGRETVYGEAPVAYTPSARVSAYTAARQPEPEPESRGLVDVAEPAAALSLSAARGGDSESRLAQDADPEPVRGSRPEQTRTPDASATGERDDDAARRSHPEQTRTPDASASGWRKWLATLDKMPPIRLPIGPAIPWRYGLPALLVLVAVVAVMSRPSGARSPETRSVLPTQELYGVQADGPLFATPTAATTDDAGATPVVVSKQPAPIGVQEPAGAGFDLLDIGIKLAAVLGLAYGSLVLLKKAGVGGAGRLSPGVLNGADGMRVVGTVTLAPNRSVHALRVPDGRTLLIGATPNSVNLLTELGELDDNDAVEAPGLLDGIRARLH